MTKKLKIFIIAVLGLIATTCICVVAGCNNTVTVDKLKEQYGLSTQITYFINNPNGGSFENESFVKNMYYAEGAKPYDISVKTPVSGSATLKAKTGYSFTGWYEAELVDGTPVYNGDDDVKYSEEAGYDANKGIKSSGKKFNFETPLEANQHIYLCGDWSEDMRLRLYLDCKDEDFVLNYSVTVGDESIEHNVKNGDELVGLEYLIDRQTGLGDITSDIKIPGYTVYGLYEYDNPDQPFTSWPIRYEDYEVPEEDNKYNDAKVRVKLIEGTWNIVKTASDFGRLFSNASLGYYIDKDIDCEGATFSNINNFSGKIKGNGHTISNFKILRASALSADTSASLLGNIRSSAVIEDVTFKDFTLSFTIRSNAESTIRMVCNGIEDGAKINGFNITGCTMDITLNSKSIATINNNDWLFGGKDDATYTDIKVSNSSCTVSADPDDETSQPKIFNKD